MNGVKNIEINPDWFYHRVTSDTIGKIIHSGSILSMKYINDRKVKLISSHNGHHYISLAKKVVGIKIPNLKADDSLFVPGYSKETRGIDSFLKRMEEVSGIFPFIDIEEGKMIEKTKIKEYIINNK